MRDATAAEIVDLALQKPELVIHGGSLPATAEALRDLLAASGKLFDRGLPVRVIRPGDGSLPSAVPLTKHNVVIEAHRLCQPVKGNREWQARPGDVTGSRRANVSRHDGRVGFTAARRRQPSPLLSADGRSAWPTDTIPPPACGAAVFPS